MNATECGAACLAMILSAHGRATRVTECSGWLGSGRNGVSAQALLQAARQAGLEGKAFAIPDLDLLAKLGLPAIAHWNGNHFVVVERSDDTSVTFIDPAVGRRTVTRQDFALRFSGVLLTFTPGTDFVRRAALPWQPWRLYLHSFFQTPQAWRFLLQILVASVVLQLCGLGFPFFTRLLIDRVLAVQQLDLLTTLGVGMLALIVSQTVTSYLRGLLLTRLQIVVDRHLMVRFLGHILHLPYRFFQQRSSGDLLMRLSSNSLLREMVTNQSVALLLDGSVVLAYSVILWAQASSFALLALGIGLLQSLLLLVTLRAMQHLMQRELGAQAEVQSYLVVWRAAGRRDARFDEWAGRDWLWSIASGRI